MKHTSKILIGVIAALTCLAGCAHNAEQCGLSSSIYSDMMYLRPDNHSARSSSWDQTGKNRDFETIMPGATLDLANIEGAGCIRHIYFTIAAGPQYMRDLVLRMYWDGESSPSVETPFGDFFGLGHERVEYFRTMMICVNEGGNGLGGTQGFNSYFPMPFADGARLTLTNEGDQPVAACWYHINYETFPKLDANVGRFHAQWRRQNPTAAKFHPDGSRIIDPVNIGGEDNYVILDAVGTGNVAGYFLNVENIEGGWYGEGDDMIFIDGEEWPPSFHGTGSEEIFGGGACPNVPYTTPFEGFHLVANPNFDGKTSTYRFFAPDPIRFEKSIKVTIEHGAGNNLANDYSSTAFWYQTEPHAPFPQLPPPAERRARTGDDPYELAYAALQNLQGLMHHAIGQVQAGNPEANMEMVAEMFLDQSVRLPRKFEAREYEEVIEAYEQWEARITEIEAAAKTE